MFRRLLLLLSLVTMVAVVSLLVLPISAKEAEKEKRLPPPEGEALMEYITKTRDYTKWPMWPGKEALYKGTEPHGVLLTTYVNPPALKAIKGKADELPDNAIVVKENYTPDKKLAAVTVMYKVKGYNAGAGDFFWLKYSPDGKIAAEGKVDSCIQCHKAAPGKNFVYTTGSEE